MSDRTNQTVSNAVFLTGATGFIGKVVLVELLRRRQALNIDEIFLLIRPRGDHSPGERFRESIVDSPATDNLNEGWTAHCTVVGGELTEPSCGLNPSDVRRVTEATTHIIHCAASVEFTLPVEEAVCANVDTCLNVLELAKACPSLEAMTSVSTAYVTPFESEDVPVYETPVPLPQPAQAYYRQIKEGQRTEAEMLEETGHPNTYTFTKCIAEHLLMQRRDDVPLRVVRPSVVSPSMERPHPGWVDSMAAYSGYLAFIGLGHLRAFIARPDNRLDVIPCDHATDRIIESAFGSPPRHDQSPVPIVHAVAGYEKSCRMDMGTRAATRFFSEHRIGSGPRLAHMGPPEHGFDLASWRHQKLPHLTKDALLRLVGASRARRGLQQIEETAQYMNEAFYYFTNNTFDFRSSRPLDDHYDPVEYMETAVRGIYRHLLGGDDGEMILAGRRDWDQRGDLEVVTGNPGANLSVNLLGCVLRRFLNRYAEKVTFDKDAFDTAMARKPDDAVAVIVPTHRSFMDFLLCSYLFYVRPELGIELPHIPATSDFQDVAIVNRLFEHAKAFYIERGVGCAQEQVNAKIEEIVEDQSSLMFFPEGTRSRSRRFLAPRRGLLRALRRTGQRCHLLPVTISFDRIPEQRAIERELRGRPRGKLRLSSLLRWSLNLLGDDFDLGRIHIDCAPPLTLDDDSDVYELARTVSARHQATLAVSTFHLRTFIKRQDLADDLDVQWLADAIERRGGRVISSRLQAAVDEPLLERSLRYHWLHWFYDDARSLLSDHPAIRHHLKRNHRGELSNYQPKSPAPRLRALLEHLFSPIAEDYLAVTRHLSRLNPDGCTAPTDLVDDATPFLPYVRGAFELLCERQIIEPVDDETSLYSTGPNFDAIHDLIADLKRPITTDDSTVTSMRSPAAQ